MPVLTGRFTPGVPAPRRFFVALRLDDGILSGIKDFLKGRACAFPQAKRVTASRGNPFLIELVI